MLKFENHCLSYAWGNNVPQWPKPIHYSIHVHISSNYQRQCSLFLLGLKFSPRIHMCRKFLFLFLLLNLIKSKAQHQSIGLPGNEFHSVLTSSSPRAQPESKRLIWCSDNGRSFLTLRFKTASDDIFIVQTQVVSIIVKSVL